MYKLNTDFEAVVILEKFALEMSQLHPVKETSITSDTDTSEPEISMMCHNMPS
jgi:hypothetical protein